jgi:hypothetical protein
VLTSIQDWRASVSRLIWANLNLMTARGMLDGWKSRGWLCRLTMLR